jgi:L-lactate utilization protein LutB
MAEPTKLAMLECSLCGSCIDVFGAYDDIGPTLAWTTRDDGVCGNPPVGACPQASAEIQRRFPAGAGSQLPPRW